MENAENNYFSKKIVWQENKNPEYPYVASSNGRTLKLRINDFPEENLYTLLENEKEIADFDDFPANWEKSK